MAGSGEAGPVAGHGAARRHLGWGVWGKSTFSQQRGRRAVSAALLAAIDLSGCALVFAGYGPAMADRRGQRRAAERHARRLLSGKVSFIGDVGEAAAAQLAAQEAVQAARDRARELIEQARREGERLVDGARAGLAEAEAGYAEAFGRATEAGWSAAMLTALGYQAPARP